MPATQYAYRQYAGNGSTTTFAVPFPYLLKAHVKVYTGYDLASGAYTSLLVDGTNYTWTSATQIQTTTAPAAGVTLTVIRQTPSTTQLVQWQDGSNLIASDIDTADKQNLYVVQEQQDKNEAAVAIAQSAQATANSAAAAVGAAGIFVPVANVAAIPGSPSSNQAIQVNDSTGIESFSPLTGRPAGFVGDSGLGVRIVYNATSSSWIWYGYFASDSDARYAKLSGAAFTGAVLGSTSTSAASPNFAFSGDTDTGMVRLGANELGLVTGGTLRLSFDSSGNGTFSGPITIPAGSTLTGYLTAAIASTTYQPQSGMSSYLTTSAAASTYGAIDVASTWTRGQRAEITALTDGATITPDLADSNNFSVILAGNRTLANPTNIVAGQSGSIFISQDGTGSRTLAYGSYWDFAGGTAPTLSTAASAVDRLDYIVRTSTSIHAVLTKALS